MPYRTDLSAALRELREQVFEAGEFHSPAEWGLPVPETLAEFDALGGDETYGEFLGTCSTHSILDVDAVIVDAAAANRSCAFRPLTPAETLAVFGTERPTRVDYERVGMPDNELERWSGSCVVLHHDGEPAWIAFWGWSGD
ncbi:hypothetical protein ACIRL2_19225 [Embleya sp. NPDC127516]|uniref:hypothetical protein n=1 Tax=Embleya sp. NPDC127516 TaxID=3363990 RepID=UPI00380A9BCF